MDAETLLFFCGHEEVLPLYERFEELLRSSFPEVNKRVQKTQITFFNRHVFACVSFTRVKKKSELPDGYLVVKVRAVPRPVDASYCHQQAGRPGYGTAFVDPGSIWFFECEMIFI